MTMNSTESHQLNNLEGKGTSPLCHIFAVITPLGLEKFCQEEIIALLAQVPPTQVKSLPQILGPGQIELQGDLEIGVLLTFNLKTATRVLLRMGSFRVRDFSRLYKKLENIPWKNFVSGQEIIWKITSKESRLFHTKRLEECAQKAILSHWRHHPPPKAIVQGIKQNIYLRLEQDQATLSLDLCGDRLDRRSFRDFTSGAPMRETLAHALLIFLNSHLKSHPELSPLYWDPFCGAGTIIWEHLTTGLKLAPSRSFSFQTQSLFTKIRPQLFFQSWPSDSSYDHFYGSDINESLIQKNQHLLQTKPEAKTYTFLQMDALNTNPILSKKRNLVIVSNPPYGIRLGGMADGQEIPTFDLVKRVAHLHHPQMLALVLPSNNYGDFKNYSLSGVSEAINNQGIKVRFYLWKRR